MTDRGTYLEFEGRPAVRFQRTYPHPVEEVWAAVTDSDELKTWFPSAVSMEQREGGAIAFSGDPYAEDTTGTILTFDPPRRLAYSWADGEIHFELEPTDTGCTLTLINVLDVRNAAARNAAGWDVCLGLLGQHLAGEQSAGPHSDSFEDWERIYGSYVAAGLPSGADVPDLA